MNKETLVLSDKYKWCWKCSTDYKCNCEEYNKSSETEAKLERKAGYVNPICHPFMQRILRNN